MFEEDIRSRKDIEQDLCREYDLEFYEKQSLLDIERMIASKGYRDHEVIREHMDFLEHLMLKLHSIRIEELKEGFPTLELDASIAKIKDLSQKLTTLLYAIDPDLHFAAALPTHRFKY